MLKNITFSADERIIKKAREKAMRNNTTLNELFRHWLKQYAKGTDLSGELDDFLRKVEYATSGRKFTRDEFNER